MDTGSTLPRRQLGGYLREARTALNLSIEVVAGLVDVSSSVLQRAEKGEATRMRVRDLQALCEVLEMSDEMTAAMIGLLQQSAATCWWHEYGNLIPADFDVYVGLETAARSLTVYQPHLVHGLLQTPDYVRALVQNGYPRECSAEHERRVELRTRRQTILTRRHGPLALDLVLHESVLRTLIGNAKVMAAQLRRLAEVGKLPNVSIRVLPFTAGAPVGNPLGQFAILKFEGGPKGAPVTRPIVYLETFTGCIYLDKPNDIQRYDQVHGIVQRTALDETDSRCLLRQVAKEFSP